MQYVEDIANLGMPDADEAGGKGANMGEMVKAGLPVPPGFVVLRDSYLESIRAGGVADELNATHREAMLHTLDGDSFNQMCAHMKALDPRTTACTRPWTQRYRCSTAMAAAWR